MSFALEKVFTTRTALPQDCEVIEIEPIAALKPYIRCFWTCGRENMRMPMRIIPDCCADIIIDTDNRIANFVGVCFDSFIVRNIGTIFGIRFYAWAVCRFAPLVDASCPFTGLDDLFYGFSDFIDRISDASNFARRVELAQRYLLKLLNCKSDSDVMNSVYYMVMHNGNASINDLSDYIAVSKRTLERKFMQSMGVSPKAVAELIRYQLLWQDCISSDFYALDCVEKFGYYDQAHMLNDFKRYHGLVPSEARKEYFKLSHFSNTDK